MKTDTLVIGTAGHIDHGKTSLVRSLTGVDLDALPEEQQRGITIALGFTALELPDGRRAGFVDVPGHERLVRTMIAGATGSDAVLLFVSAVDGVMPQTREHLAILRMLGVSDGVVALTMSDLVDEEMRELAQEDVSDAIEGSFLEDKPIIPFSSVTGVGREELLQALTALQPAERDADGPFRLPVDRAFVRPGFGTVVSGTVWSGTLPDGATVTLLPSGETARVRGIESHGQARDRAEPGRRTALNLAGVDRQQAHRGVLVTDGPVPTPSMVDVMYHHLPSAPPLADGAPVRVLLGTAECLGRLHLAADLSEARPGSTNPAQIRLDGPLPCLRGDRFIVRRTSPVTTLGGGRIVDPFASRMRKKHRMSHGEEIERLDRGEDVVWLERAGELGLSPKEWSERSGTPDLATPLGDRVFAPRVVSRLEGRLLEALANYHAEQPLSLGAHRRELRRGRLGHLPDRVFDALVDKLSEHHSVRVHGPLVRVEGFEVQLTKAQTALQERLAGTITAAGIGGISVKALHEAHPEPEVAALLKLVEAEGTAVQVAGVGWVRAAALSELSGQVRSWFSDHDVLAPADFKELTGLTRKSAIPLLEWLDREGLTQRRGNERIAGPTTAS